MTSADSRIKAALLAKSIFLDLSDMDLTEIPPEISSVAWLEVVDLSNNQLSDLSPLASLKNLRSIDVRNNRITHFDAQLLALNIPVRWKPDRTGDGIFLAGNPVVSPPIEVLQLGNDAIHAYFDSLRKEGSVSAGEARVILLGEPGAGKTSLVRALENEAHHSHTAVTHGIQVDTHAEFIGENNRLLNVSYWDFGGQYILQTIYQLLLTPDTLYLLVVDPGSLADEKKVVYWLDTIRAFARDAPVIIVINKIDIDHRGGIDELYLKYRYANLVSINKVSCLTKKGIDELRNVIYATLDRHILIRQLPVTWVNVKQHLKSLDAEYIEYSSFREICAEYGILDFGEQDLLSSLLHNSGTILHFRHLRLFPIVIINLHWLLNGVVHLLASHELRVLHGRLDSRAIKLIFSVLSSTYPPDIVSHIVDIMVEFGILFEMPDNTYLMPQFLPPDTPELNIDLKDSIGLMFRYDFLPPNLFPRVVVSMQRIGPADIIWRNGILITKDDSKVLVTQSKAQYIIEIHITGSERKELFVVVCEAVRKINQSYIELGLTELVSNDGNDLLTNKVFRIYRHQVEKGIWYKSADDVQNSLAQIQPANIPELNPVKIFISYADEDQVFKNQLLSHLSPLTGLNEIVVWDKAQLTGGQRWESETLVRFRESDLVLCLISSDFFKYEFSRSVEMSEALTSHQRKQKVVIPVLVRKCYWEKSVFAQVKGIPEPPISSQVNADEGWYMVVTEVDRSVDEIRKLKYRE